MNSLLKFNEYFDYQRKFRKDFDWKGKKTRKIDAEEATVPTSIQQEIRVYHFSTNNQSFE